MILWVYILICEVVNAAVGTSLSVALFASLKKQAEILFWLIYCERKILFRL